MVKCDKNIFQLQYYNYLKFHVKICQSQFIAIVSNLHVHPLIKLLWEDLEITVSIGKYATELSFYGRDQNGCTDKHVYISHVYCCHLVVPFMATNNSHYHRTTVACHRLLYAFNMKPPTHIRKHAATSCNTSSTILNLEHMCYSVSHLI